MIKRRTGSLNLDLVLDAADKFSIRYTPLVESKLLGYLEKDNKKLFVRLNGIGVNNSVSYIIAWNKNTTTRILDRYSLPCPKAILLRDYRSFEDVKKEIKDLVKPLVVKPKEGYGGKGVTLELNTDNEVQDSIRYAKKYCEDVIIEEYVEGTNYRIVVFRGDVLDVVLRIPAFILGDGKKTIEALIIEKNDRREKIGLSPIVIDHELKFFLSKHNLNLSEVVLKGRRVELRGNCNMSTGGETSRVSLTEVHKDNIELFTKTASILGLELAGIDYITPDITKSYVVQKTAINEVNKEPMLYVNYFADMKLDNFVAEEIIKRYFESK